MHHSAHSGVYRAVSLSHLHNPLESSYPSAVDLATPGLPGCTIIRHTCSMCNFICWPRTPPTTPRNARLSY
eukprot:366028-Chlamydomonas_euryale.AAC.44